MADHVQCRLRRGDTVQVAWIPSTKAIVGRVVRLKEEDGSWTEGWEVLSVDARMPSDLAIERQRDWTHQRKASDV